MAAGRLDVLLGLNAAEFTKGLSKAEYATQKFQKEVQQSLSGIGTAFKALVGVVAVKEIVDGFVSIVGALDDLDEAAQALGTTAVALSEFRRSAAESGVSAEKFDGALTKLSVKLTDAASGGKESAAAFKALGIDIKNSSGQLLTTEELLGKVADKFAGYADGAEKTALAVQLFGKAGAAMIPYLNQGADGLRKFAGVTQESVEAAKKLQAQFDSLKAGLGALGIGIATSVIPFLSKMVEEFIAAQNAAGGFFGALKLLAKQSADTLADPGAKIEDLRKELEKLQATAGESRGLFGNVDNKERIEALNKELAFLKELQRNRALANAGTPYGNEGRQALVRAPVVPDTGTPKKEKIDESTQAYARYVDQLAQGLEKEQQLSKVQEVTRAIEQNRFGTLIPQQKELLLLLAAQADAADEYAAKIKHNAELEREQMRAMQERADLIDTKTGRKAARETEKELQIFGEEFKEGRINFVEYQLATHDYYNTTREEIKKTNDAAEQLGLTFASAIGDFIRDPTGGGKGFLDALIADLLQLTTQLLIIKPLAEGMTEIFGGSAASSSGGKQVAGFGKMIADFFSGMNFAVGTNYVPQDGLAMVHKGEAIIPREHNRGGSTFGDIVVNLPAGTPGGRETANQTAAAISRVLATNNRRLN